MLAPTRIAVKEEKQMTVKGMITYLEQQDQSAEVLIESWEADDLVKGTGRRVFKPIDGSKVKRDDDGNVTHIILLGDPDVG